MQVTRRGLLAGAAVGGGLLVAWGLWPRDYGVPLTPGRGEWAFGAWLKLARDGVLTVAVPQLYVNLPDGSPLRLAGWSRQPLAPHETRQVTIVADPRVLARWRGGRAAAKANQCQARLMECLPAQTAIASP